MDPSRTPPIRRHQPLPHIAWEKINEPGAYVEVATGALYRIPRESLAGGACPLVEKAGAGVAQPVRADANPPRDSQFVRVSGNPHIFTLGARMICVEHNIQPHF